MDCDVVVIGAGLAGLECARTLRELGREVHVVEAADAVGGRVRSEKIDGYTLDRGFQLLNPAYPMVRERIDVDSLALQTFDAGVAVRRDDALAVLGDPRRAPKLLKATLSSGYLRPRELLALARWAAPALGPVPRLLAREDATLEASLEAAKVDGRLRREVLEPFLAGVLADGSGRTSATFVRLLVRMFLLGSPGVPAGGMGALPQQIADRLPGRITLGTPVMTVEKADGGLWRVVADGASWATRAVVVATDPDTAEGLAGVPAPAMKGLVTAWYATDEPPSAKRLLFVDGRRPAGRPRGPVVNAAVMSNAAPTYAPAGRHLVEVTCLLGPEAPAEEVARRQAGEMFGCETRSWQQLARHEIPRALPVQPAPLATRRDVALGGELFVCGDHRDTASIQGALVSGYRTAHAVDRALAG
jgi:phytoene dehydrogenase-like protein